MKDKVLAILDQLQINYSLLEHDAVFTIEAAEKFWGDIEGAHCKNLFFRDRKGKQHFLVVADKNTRISIKELGDKLGNEKLSFASEKRLDKYLQLTKGSVSPFGLINDAENHVRVLLDRQLKNYDIVNFHPNINTSTVSLSLTDFERFLEWSGNTFEYFDFSK